MFLLRKKKNSSGLFNLFFYLKKKKKGIITFKKWVSCFKKESGLMEECSYFVSDVLVKVRHVFLQDYLLVLSQLKLRSVGVFWNQKNMV